MSLRYRVRRRGRKAPPLSVIRGHELHTWVSCEVYQVDAVQSRDYVHMSTEGDYWWTELERADDDRRAWEEHWRLRRMIRRALQRSSGPRPLAVRMRKA